MKTDLKLVQEIKEGNVEAFDKLYEKYYSIILRFYKSNIKNSAEAEDFATEAIVKCYNNINKFSEDSAAFSTWMFAIARNLFIDKLRKRKLETSPLQDITTSEGDVIVREFKSSELNPEEILITNL